MRDGLRYKIGIIRNGMYITDNLSYFNEPFKRFPLHRDFAVIIEPADETASEWFKRLENPRHDSLSADRITDPNRREKGRRVFGKLVEEIRSRIRERAKSQPSDSVELDELSDFFALDEKRIKDDIGMDTDPKLRKLRGVKRIKPRPSPSPNPRKVKLISERVLIPDWTNPSKRRIIFTPPITAEIALHVNATGLTYSERLNPVSTSEGQIENSAVVVSCIVDRRTSIDVIFDATYAGPVEISASRVEDEQRVGGTP